MTGRRGTMPLAEFLATVRDGDEHGWDTEEAFLRSHHRARLDQLRAEILQNGIQDPIEIGDDGRCWDGHHRVVIAMDLGLAAIPINDRRPPEGAAPLVSLAPETG